MISDIHIYHVNNLTYPTLGPSRAMNTVADADLPFRHYISALLELRALIARTKVQAQQLCELHDDLPDFLTEPKWALHRALQLYHRAVEELEKHEASLTIVIRNTLVQTYCMSKLEDFRDEFALIM